MPDGGTQLQSTGESWPITITEFTYDNGHTSIHYQVKQSKSKHKTGTDSKKPAPPSLSINNFIAKIESLKNQFNNPTDDLDLQTAYLGKKGYINQLSKTIPQLNLKDRKKAGVMLNQLKSYIQDRLDQTQKQINPYHHA